MPTKKELEEVNTCHYMVIMNLMKQVYNKDEEIKHLKTHFNLLIELVKGCDTEEKLTKLKELNKLKNKKICGNERTLDIT